MRSRRARVKEGRQRRKGADGAAGPGGRRRVAATGRAGGSGRQDPPPRGGRLASVCRRAVVLLREGLCPRSSFPHAPALERGACRPSAAGPARVLRYKVWRVRGESLAEARARMAPGQPDPGRHGQASQPPPQERNARSSGARPGRIAAAEGRPSVAAGPDLTPPVWAAACRTRAAPIDGSAAKGIRPRGRRRAVGGDLAEDDVMRQPAVEGRSARNRAP